MTSDLSPAGSPAHVIARCAQLLANQAFSAGEAAALRRMTPEALPMAFHRFAAAALPPDWTRCTAEWVTTIKGLALLGAHGHAPKVPLGEALAHAGISEQRMERLLSARGDTLCTLALRTARVLAQKNQRANWSQMASLLFMDDDRRIHLGVAVTRAYFRTKAAQ